MMLVPTAPMAIACAIKKYTSVAFSLTHDLSSVIAPSWSAIRKDDLDLVIGRKAEVGQQARAEVGDPPGGLVRSPVGRECRQLDAARAHQRDLLAHHRLRRHVVIPPAGHIVDVRI